MPSLRASHRLILPAVLVATVLLAAPTSAGWSSAKRIFAATGQPAHSMVLDSEGYVYVATEGGTGKPGIYLVTNASGAWQSEKVTSSADRWPSIAFEDGSVYISFTRRTSGQLGVWTATNESGDWDVQPRHSGDDGASSLGVHGGTAHIAIRAAGGKLIHRFGPAGSPSSAGGWTTETIDGSCCSGVPSLGLTTGGAARVAYPDGTSSHPAGLRYASRASGGAWSSQKVDSHKVKSVTLQVAEDGKPHVVFVRSSDGTWYANRGTSGWGSFLHLRPTGYGTPDLAVFSGALAFVYGSSGKISYQAGGSLIFPPAVTICSSHCSRPELQRYGGGQPSLIYDKYGTSSDGIYYRKYS